MGTLAETIRNLTRSHLMEGNGLLFAQNVTAVGWIANTVPDNIPNHEGIVELPTSDVSNSGIVVGAALVGRRPIYVVRYQGFLWYNLASIVNYAAKSKFLWDVPCPVFVRALAMEGAIGPVASNSHHSMAMRMPGIKIAAPMTPKEWKSVWEEYVSGDDPVLCSESKSSFGISEEMEDVIVPGAEVTLLSVSPARLNARKAADILRNKIPCNSFGQLWLKPTQFRSELLESLKCSRFGVVIDSDYEVAGASQSIAYELTHRTGTPVLALGLEDRTAGFSKATDNVTPSVDTIVNFVLGEVSQLRGGL